MEINAANLKLSLRAPLSRRSFQAALQERRTQQHSSSSSSNNNNSSAADGFGSAARKSVAADGRGSLAPLWAAAGGEAAVVAAVRAELDQIKRQTQSFDRVSGEAGAADGEDGDAYKLAVMHKYIDALAREMVTKTVQWRKDSGGGKGGGSSAARTGILSQSLSSSSPSGGGVARCGHVLSV